MKFMTTNNIIMPSLKSLIGFSILILTIVSCEKIFEKDELALIRDAIEEELIKDMNNPDSYSFVDIQLQDTVHIKDIYLHEIQLIDKEIDLTKSELNKAEIVESEELLKGIIYLRDVFRVYATGNELTLINEVISNYNKGEAWLPKLNELERYIRNSEVQSYRYRNELPIFDRIRNKAVELDLSEHYQSWINALVEESNIIQNYIESNDDKMSEIAFYRIIFSHREQNIFGGIQLIRKMHEVRFNNNEIELMWTSDNFDPNDEAFNNLSDIPYGEGMRLLKTELSLD